MRIYGFKLGVPSPTFLFDDASDPLFLQKTVDWSDRDLFSFWLVVKYWCAFAWSGNEFWPLTAIRFRKFSTSGRKFGVRNFEF